MAFGLLVDLATTLSPFFLSDSNQQFYYFYSRSLSQNEQKFKGKDRYVYKITTIHDITSGKCYVI